MRAPLANENPEIPSISVLIDVSGSTRTHASSFMKQNFLGDSVYQCFINAGYTLDEIFRSIGIKTLSVAHTTSGQFSRKGSQIYVLSNNFSPKIPSGMFWFDHEFINNAGNNDAAAIEYVSTLTEEKHKFIIVISDGLPAESSIPGLSGAESLKIASKKLKSQGYRILALGLDEQLTKNLKEFYDFVINMEEPGSLDKIVREIFRNDLSRR